MRTLRKPPYRLDGEIGNLKNGRASSLKIYSLDRARPEICWEILENANVLVKMALRKIFPNVSI